MTVVLASDNQGKLRELRELLKDTDMHLISKSDAGCFIEVDETGETFEENAYLKASSVAKETGQYALADDSGLCIDALGGEPGVHSARYMDGIPYPQRMERILALMDSVPQDKRTARFVCVICLCAPDGTHSFHKGVCEGHIGYEQRGGHGFGYDPIFMVDGRALAELPEDEKNALSHRGRAISQLMEKLRNT